MLFSSIEKHDEKKKKDRGQTTLNNNFVSTRKESTLAYTKSNVTLIVVVLEI